MWQKRSLTDLPRPLFSPSLTLPPPTYLFVVTTISRSDVDFELVDLSQGTLLGSSKLATSPKQLTSLVSLGKLFL